MKPRLLLAAVAVGGVVGAAAVLAPTADLPTAPVELSAPDDYAATTTPTTTGPASFRPTVTASIPAPPLD